MSLVEKALEKMQRSPRGEVRDAGTPTIPAPATAVREHLPSARVLKLDRGALIASGLLPPENQARLLADQYRQIKRPLVRLAQSEAASPASRAHLVMVSSAMPGDGKTFTALNLTMSIAKERDFNVVLVDADVAKPHLSRLFGLERDVGLLDALRDDAVDLESCILPTDITGLSVLPSGRRSDNATELLASQRMADLFRQLKANDARRMLVLDSSPLLVTNESRVLATSVGQVVVVVRSGKTAQRDVLEALGYLDSSRQNISLVLNQSLSTSAGYTYGYGDQVAESSVAKD